MEALAKFAAQLYGNDNDEIVDKGNNNGNRNNDIDKGIANNSNSGFNGNGKTNKRDSTNNFNVGNKTVDIRTT